MDTFMDKLASKINAQEMIRANSSAEAKENERLSQEVEEYRQCLQEMRQISLQNSATADEIAELVKTSMDKIAAIQAESGKSDDVVVVMQNNLNEMLNAIRMNSDKLVSVVSGNADRVMSAVEGSSDKVMSAVEGSSDKVMSAVEGSTDKVMNALEGSTDKIVSNVIAELQAGNDEFKEALKAEIIAEVKKELKGQEEIVHKECVKVYRNVQAVVTEESEKQTGEIVAAQSKGRKRATAAMICGILAMSFAFLGLVVSVLDVLGIFSMLF